MSYTFCSTDSLINTKFKKQCGNRINHLMVWFIHLSLYGNLGKKGSNLLALKKSPNHFLFLFGMIFLATVTCPCKFFLIQAIVMPLSVKRGLLHFGEEAWLCHVFQVFFIFLIHVLVLSVCFDLNNHCLCFRLLLSLTVLSPVLSASQGLYPCIYFPKLFVQYLKVKLSH